MSIQQIGVNEWLLIAGTILGPVLAVQAQKWVERSRESDNRKRWVLYTLMSTRGSRLADDHVRALNSIDLVFYGVRMFGKPWRSKKAQAVIDAWHEYHEQLGTSHAGDPGQWATKGDELFWNLLSALAVATNHEFQRQTLRTGGYSPIAHGAKEQEQDALRRYALDVLEGNRNLPLEIKAFPLAAANPSAQEEQRLRVEEDRQHKVRLLAALERLADGSGPWATATEPRLKAGSE